MATTHKPPTSVHVRVPGTTANLGPGYDVLGLALNVWMDVTVTVSEAFGMTVTGFGAADVATDDSNFLVRSCQLAFSHKMKKLPPLHYTVHNDIPFGCGVGSSSAAATAGYVAGLVLCGETMPTKDSEGLLAEMVALEGHPDNAAPAIYGGMQIGYNVDGEYKTARVPVPQNLHVVLFSPFAKMKQNTHATRGLVPAEVPMTDAVHNMSRTALITLAMATNQLHLLEHCNTDRFHQPQRFEALFPFAHDVIAAAREAGACYAFLSGAGPTICAFVDGKTTDLLCQDPRERVVEKVAVAMREAAIKKGVDGASTITTPAEKGAHVVGRIDLGNGVILSQ